MRKLKPNAVVTLGCGGVLFFATLGILSEVVGKLGSGSLSSSNSRHDLVELELKPGETSEWINRPKDVETFMWDYPNALADYLDSELEFVDGSKKVEPIGAIENKPISRARFMNRGKGISAKIKVWYRKTAWKQ